MSFTQAELDVTLPGKNGGKDRVFKVRLKASVKQLQWGAPENALPEAL